MPEHADARVVTANRTTEADRQKGIWIVETRIYLTAGDQAMDLPKATGWAFEVDGTKGANLTSALENCETSSIGRCLANMNLSGNKRASREEMQKVQRNQTPKVTAETAILSTEQLKEAVKKITATTTIDQLKALWASYAEVVDQAFTNSLGDEISLKTYFMEKSKELKGE
jgi:hypothetical protein